MPQARKLHGDDRAEGLAAARAWRMMNKARFDALYPGTVSPVRCPYCEQHVPASSDLARG